MESIISVSEITTLFGEQVSAAPAIDRAMLADALFEIFKDVTLDGLVALITNQYTEALEYIGLCKGEKRCQKTSLLFNPHRLDTRTESSQQSIYYAVKDRRFHSGLARATLFKHGLVSELFYQVLQLGINGVQYVNEFPPQVAREICLHHGISKSSIILDPCAGWGGRLLGVSTLADEYVCYEPSTRTATGLARLAEFIQLFRPEFTAMVMAEPFENSREHLECYDFALTSPPYYNTEIYSDEPTNSLNRYATFDAWCAGFYLPMMDKVMRQLKPSSAFVLNIGDRRYPLSERMKRHCDGRYTVEKLPNYLSGKSGLGKDGAEGEMFFRLTRS